MKRYGSRVQSLSEDALHRKVWQCLLTTSETRDGWIYVLDASTLVLPTLNNNLSSIAGSRNQIANEKRFHLLRYS